MSAAARIGGFAAILAAVFAAAAFAGAEIDPSVDESDTHEEEAETMSAHNESKNGASSHGAADPAAAPPGLAVAEAGLRLVPQSTSYRPSEEATYRFRIVDAEGETVRDFDVEHEREMHLILVRRDFEAFQHLHPRMLDDGTWEAVADLSEPGAYRAFADFASAGTSTTLATDLFVAGAFEPRSLPPVARTASAGDGYEVTLDSANPRPGGQTPVSFTVRRDGALVDSVEAYLGADGHLVALREHDQAFLHTHPEGDAGGSGPIRFDVSYPTAGRYRLFLQFRHAGEVRTAAFTQEVGDDAGFGAPAGHEEGAAHGH